ncbi:MAG: helix-turn-helix domain-containing protein [Phycisphaerales bacterium]|nr:MAG: helix-turn-helix domain-containing protein [Phycisphaerales bacterium]
MTVAEVAVALNVSRKIVYELIHEGSLLAVNLAMPYARARYRVDREDLIAFVSRRKTNMAGVRTARRSAVPAVPNYIGI